MTETRYARAGDTHIGYTVLDGGRDLDHTIMFANGTHWPFESMVEQPAIRRFLDGLAALGRLVLFDRRGIGCSDGIDDWQTPLVEQWADDIAAVVEDAQLDAVTLFADLSAPSLVWAARQPPQLDRLILWNHLSQPRPTDVWAEELGGMVFANIDGEADLGAVMNPEASSDPDFRAWSDRAGRAGASPATARRLFETTFAQGPTVALEQRLAHVVDPTLVLVRVPDPLADIVPDDYWRLPMNRLPNATFVDLSPGDSFPAVDVDPILAEVTAFVTGRHVLPPPERILVAVLLTDLVESTTKAQTLGDAAWKRLLDAHDSTVHAAVGRRGGTVVKTTGDGILATLPTASAALSAALEIRSLLDDLELACRVGIHVGEVDQRGSDISGLAVNVAARVMGSAEPGQVLASAMAVHAAAGQGFTVTSLGTRELRGLDGAWELYSLG